MKTILLKNVNILDGTKDMVLKENRDIYIKNGKIDEIGKNIDVKADKVIDLSGKYITPGLINLHVHLPGSGKLSKKKVADMGKLIDFILSTKLTRRIGISICASNARNQLYSGTTTVRAVGGIGNLDTALRDEINSGKQVGPRLLVSNTAIAVPGGHMVGTVSKGFETTNDAVKFIEEQYKEGIDLVKIMVTGGVLDCKEVGKPGELKMSEEMIKACTDKAHELGLKVAAHDEGPEGVELAMLNGVDTIEHGAPASKEAIEALKERDGSFVLTLSPAIPLAKLPIEVLGYPEAAKINSNVLLDGMIKLTKDCFESGVKVGLGTDTACPLVTHYDMWRELYYYTKFIDGVTNNFAIHTATLINAKIAGVDNETGSIEKGKYADMVVLNSNPLDDISAYRNPYEVFYKGKAYKKKAKKFDNVESILDGIYKELETK